MKIEDIIVQTDASGAPVRLEYVHGRPHWELSPALTHQRIVDRIRATLRPDPSEADSCGCFHYADVLIKLGSSFKRPDIALFCDDPPDQGTALAITPAAVIEIISEGYEEKDLGEDGAPFYIAQGVLDVLVVDPRSNEVHHFRPGQPKAVLISPIEVRLACGCLCRL
jgi:Uma2 family endonuclease